jgi:hypothetical protein
MIVANPAASVTACPIRDAPANRVIVAPGIGIVSVMSFAVAKIVTFWPTRTDELEELMTSEPRIGCDDEGAVATLTVSRLLTKGPLEAI